MNQLHVFDTYAKSMRGRIMHFDVILPEQDQAQAIEAAKHWLASIGEADADVTQESCFFCHFTTANPDIHGEVNQRGYAIYKLEGCPSE